MTIRKGAPWGALGRLPANSPCVDTDAAAAAVLYEAVRVGGRPATVGLTGGSIWEMLGGPGVAGRIDTDEAMCFPIDLGIAVADDSIERPFLGSVIARARSWRCGVAVLNGQVVGPYRLGHRSHPNDGRLDVVSWALSWSDLPKVARRARLGAHTPHPGIRESRSVADSFEVSAGFRLHVDGVLGGPTRRLRVSVVPDAGFVVL